MRASAAVERAGVPTASIVATTFLKAAEVVAKGLGMPELKIAHYPGMPMTDSLEALRDKVRRNLLPEVIDALVGPAKHQARPIEAEPEPREIVFRGTLDEVNEHFHEQLWTDGMAIIPPTTDRVERFLRFTDRDPHEVRGVCAPDNREATVWNVAINAVMAGCKP